MPGNNATPLEGALLPPTKITATAEDPGRTWTITTAHGVTVTGYLPSWATEDPSEDGVPDARLEGRLSDITHYVTFSGRELYVSPPEFAEEPAMTEVFHTSIDCTPFDADHAPPLPVATVHLVADYWVGNLDPDGLADLAQALRAQADMLEHEVRPRLAAARADWLAHHPSTATATAHGPDCAAHDNGAE
jgi:hypothetical protein